ncbi:hypothetical protein [Streptomyces sp. NPDC000618]|uniref:hypothetical protein n=1 Tax=Streptomyces sp. NPDC000618 TaxID=3154265 RepID=UPI003320CFA8
MNAKDKDRDQADALTWDENTDAAREQRRKSEADALRRRLAAGAQQPPRSLKEAVERAGRERMADDAGEDPGAGGADAPPAPGNPSDTPYRT